MSLLNAIEQAPPGVANAAGVAGVAGAGTTQLLAYYAEIASHLTVFAGLFAGVIAIFGAGFYCTYYGLKAWSAFKAVRAGKDVK